MIVDIVKKDEIVVEKDINLTMRIDVLTKERNEALKVGEELTRPVESQDEEFNRRMRKFLMKIERKDKKCQALEEELVRKESALKIFKVKECDLIVELDQAKQKIWILIENPTKLEEMSSSKATEEGFKSHHPKKKKKKGTMEEFLEEEMTDFEQLGWLIDHANMEVGTIEEPKNEVIDTLVWASGESHMEEEIEVMPDKGLTPSSSSTLLAPHLS
ncbi:hypothetical protein LWI28_004867 [Acer negundo]|uniref:Uncharacterized protein n=1 Tax=Acer negundo TaxID=4023 RepID=A0AAD5P136_ACENE|nr:hypothetical protein LWI28_004867 [Acer negundo]